PRADARLRDRATSRADFPGCVQGEPGITVDRIAAAGAVGMAGFRVAANRKFATGEILLTHPGREEAARGRDLRLDAPSVGHRSTAESRGLRHVCLAPTHPRPARSHPSNGRGPRSGSRTRGLSGAHVGRARGNWTYSRRGAPLSTA